jgi:hypothetical protein
MADWMKINTRRSMLMMIMAVALVFGAFALYKYTALFQKPAGPGVARPEGTIARVAEMLFTDPSRLDEAARRQFWSALNRVDRDERLKIIGFLWAYNRLLEKYQVAFLDDAQASIKAGKARRSAARATLEVKLIELYQGVDPRTAKLASRIIETNRRIMTRIAQKKPVRLGDRAIEFTPKLIDRLRQQLPGENKRREILLRHFLTPPAR